MAAARGEFLPLVAAVAAELLQAEVAARRLPAAFLSSRRQQEEAAAAHRTVAVVAAVAQHLRQQPPQNQDAVCKHHLEGAAALCSEAAEGHLHQSFLAAADSVPLPLMNSTTTNLVELVPAAPSTAAAACQILAFLAVYRPEERHSRTTSEAETWVALRQPAEAAEAQAL